MVTIENNTLVEIAFTLRDDSGAVLETSEEGRSFTYVHGQHRLLPGVEQALEGMRVGDEKDVTMEPEQGHGQLDPQAWAEISKGSLPPEGLVPGTELVARKPSGETMLVTVREVRNDTVVLSLNHPLAGKTLHCHLRVLQIVPQPD
jgi:FKBP-type peptidyl-prolyl cis-trans isomerase SlyD